MQIKIMIKIIITYTTTYDKYNNRKFIEKNINNIIIEEGFFLRN
jgi:hypothetical protein